MTDNAPPPRLTRQTSVQKIQENQNQIGSGLGCGTIAPAIAAVVIASQYEGGACDGVNYTVDLVTFLNVAGWMAIGQVLLYILATCCGACASEENKAAFTKLATAPSCLCFIFYLIWAAIGLYMWVNQMSAECQDEPIAKMILAWGIIQYAIIGCVGCCLMCFICFAGGVMALGGSTDNQNERTPLTQV
eukprot:260490_1